MLRDYRYETIEEMKEAATKVIYTLKKEDFHGALLKLLEWYKCIAAGGEYFEGNLSFMCVLSIKVPIQKSLETYLMILVYQMEFQMNVCRYSKDPFSISSYVHSYVKYWLEWKELFF